MHASSHRSLTSLVWLVQELARVIDDEATHGGLLAKAELAILWAESQRKVQLDKLSACRAEKVVLLDKLVITDAVAHQQRDSAEQEALQEMELVDSLDECDIAMDAKLELAEPEVQTAQTPPMMKAEPKKHAVPQKARPPLESLPAPPKAKLLAGKPAVARRPARQTASIQAAARSTSVLSALCLLTLNDTVKNPEPPGALLLLLLLLLHAAC